MVALILPKSVVTGDKKNKIRAIDFYGIIFSTSAILLLLIPVSGGGTYFLWASPMVISMITLGGICMVIFILVEWKIALMPMIQLRLFREPALFAILLQNFLFGIVYYSHMYYLPIYYQNARQYSPLTAAALTIPFVAAQSIFSILSGQYVSRCKRYGEVIWLGYTLWFVASGLILLFNRTTPKWQIVVILVLEGAGVGNVFQPTLVAAQAHSRKHDRAVVISLRNFLRSLGGAIGLALSASIFSNSLTKQISTSTTIPKHFRDSILESTLSVPDMSQLTELQREEVLDAYLVGSRSVFTMWVPLMGVCFLLCVLIKDRGLTRPEEKEASEASGGVTPRVEGDVELKEAGKGTGKEQDDLRAGAKV